MVAPSPSRVRRCGRDGHDPACAGGPQRLGRSAERGSRGDDIVDQQNFAGCSTRHELRSVDEPVGAAAARLRDLVGSAEERAAGLTEFGGHPAGQDLGLIDATVPAPGRRRRRPGDGGRTCVAGGALGHLAGKPCRRPTIGSELESRHGVSRRADVDERHRRHVNARDRRGLGCNETRAAFVTEMS